MESKSETEAQNIQSMMVFYVPEEVGSGRMGSEHAWVFAFDGNTAYISGSGSDKNIPKSFEEVENFLKDNYFELTKRNNSLPIVNTIMKAGKEKSIYEYKYGDVAYLGMGNIGYSLGVVQVKVMDGEYEW